jgi:hypothetical protein
MRRPQPASRGRQDHWLLAGWARRRAGPAEGRMRLPSIDAVTAASGYSGRIAVRDLLIVVDELCASASAASHGGICMNLHRQCSVKNAKCRAVDRQRLWGDPAVERRRTSVQSSSWSNDPRNGSRDRTGYSLKSESATGQARDPRFDFCPASQGSCDRIEPLRSMASERLGPKGPTCEDWAGLGCVRRPVRPSRGRRRVGPAGGRMPARSRPAAGGAGGFNAVQKLLTAPRDTGRRWHRYF